LYFFIFKPNKFYNKKGHEFSKKKYLKWEILLCLHVMTKELLWLGVTLVQYLSVVDALLVMMSSFVFEDLSRHGMRRANFGPLLLKSKTGQSAVIDVGTVGLIKEGTIKMRTFPVRA
jgi:hypothetical protein